MNTSAPDTSYDLYIRAGAARFSFRNSDHGVTLSGERIGWTADGRRDGAPFGNIISVHLQSGGSWQNPLSQCIVSFADGYQLTVTDGNAYGIAGAEQNLAWRRFVRDLHTRLAQAHLPTIRFTAGYQGASYHVVMIGALLLGLICVALPLVLWLITKEGSAFLLLLVGAGLCWPLLRMIRTNAPRSYDPARLPDELVG